MPSDVTQNELNILLAQLIDQIAPRRPTDEEALAVVRWAERIRIGQGLLEMVLSGDAQVRIDNDKPLFSLTEKGMAEAERLIATNRAAAELHADLIAHTRGASAVPEPEKKQ